ncbi:MAG: DegT/DnrJ/EryC1/StrS family aminotransferase [Verrucomicrobiae bacterium]|nr:DegT/DnrJ/EryC1/StrS family aminotransferase [Verrucomicrobiae bacterium]NNJ42511.1 DegT/DnrJ/EryC1/StrS family aminotransferase [Akkermansiaceae bacterium]
MHKIPFLDLKKINDRYRDELVEATTRVIDSGWYILGKEVDAFEEEFAAWTGAPHVVGLSNGLMALRLIFDAWIEQGKLQPGDGVIVPGNTFIASVLAITGAGLTPVFVDPDENTHNLTAEGIEKHLTSNVQAVMAVHLYGRICPMEQIVALCDKNGLLLIEDSAQAHGAEIKGIKTGCWGDAAAFSFYPGKNMGALGDAGAVTCKDSETARLIRSLANYGSSKKYEHVYRGGNDRLDEMQAACLRVKLPYMDADNKRRRKIAARYCAEINHPDIQLPQLPENGKEAVWHLFVVRTKMRDKLIEHMASHGVHCLVHYPIPPHHQQAYQQDFGHVSLPVSEQLAEEVVSLPISPVMTEEEVNYAIAALKNWSIQ